MRKPDVKTNSFCFLPEKAPQGSLLDSVAVARNGPALSRGQEGTIGAWKSAPICILSKRNKYL